MSVTFQEHRLGTLTSLGAQVTLPATYTINIWVKNVTLPGQEWSNLYLQNSGYKYILDANYGAIGAGTGPTRLAVSAADPLLVADTFHLVSCVFDGTTIEYYVNGVSIGSTTPAGAAPTVIDVLNGPGGQGFAAEVKDMRVYSGVATAGEILVSFNNGDGDLSPGSLGDNLVCYFKAEDLSDEQGGADATLSGVSPSNDGKYGSGWDMSTDVDGVITVPEISLATNDSVGYTAAMWVYNINNGPTAGSATSLMTGDSGPGRTYMPFYLGYNFSGSKKLFGSAVEGNNQYYQNAVDVNTGADFILDGSLSPYVNAWTHILFTALGDEIKYYINGVHVATATHTAFNGAFDITRVGNLDSGWFGKHTIGDRIDEFAIWDRVLSQSEIDSVYDNEISTALLDDGLVAKYALDTNGAESVSSNDLSTSGTVTYGVDGSHTAAEFSSGELESADVIDLTGQATVSFWAYEGTPYSYSGNNYSSFFRWGTTTGSYFDFYLLNGKIRSLHNNATSGWGDNRGTVSVPAGWNHYAMTIDPASGEKIIYLNGVAQVLTGAAFTGAFAAPQKVFLGNTSHGNAAFRLNGGKMDDTRIWTRVLSASEIAELHTAGAEVPAAPAAPAPSTIDLTVDQFDSYGDSWNGGSVTISDASGAVVHVFSGPASGVKAPAGLSEVLAVEAGTYTYVVAPGSYPGEITCTITDEYGTVLANLVGGSGTGTFDVSAPSPVITPTLTTSGGDITIAATLNAEATAAGATGWAYSLSALGAEGQPHGGTLVALGVDATITPATHEVHTVYLAAVDASGNVIVANSDTIDNSPSISVTIVKSDSYNDSWDGAFLVITHDGTGNELYNATLAGGASPLTVLVDLPYGTYSWALVGGNFLSEHSVVITLTADGTELANSAASVPSNGSFTVGPPSAAISASASVSGADITITGTANATAVSEGAANWSASLTEFGVIGATIDGAKALTALGVDAVLTVASGGTHTVYAAVVDGSGVILAKSSVDASVFLSQINVDDEMVIMAFLEHPSLNPQGTHPQLTNDEGTRRWGPVYLGDLTVKTLTSHISDPDDIGQIVEFKNGSGGTLDLNGMVKELIKKYDLNLLWGDNSSDGAFFQSVLDDTAGIQAADLLGWNGSDTQTLMFASGGGFYANYDATLITGFPTAGDLMISEQPPGSGPTTGPDGSSFLGIIAPGDTHENSPVGAATKVRVKFTGALYTTTIVVKDGNGDYFATYAPEAMAYGQEQYHADAHAARDAGTMIQMGDANGQNTDWNTTPKPLAIGIATALDGGGPYDVVGHTFEYEMAFPEGNYSVQLHPGVATADSSHIYILDANDNLVAQAASVAGGLDASYQAITVGSPVAAAAAAYQWDHGGELTHIKHFSAGYSVIGADAYGYTKEEPSDNTTTLYFASDFKTFSTFTEYTAASTGIEGSPSCLTYGTNNLWLLGTSAGKVYEIALLSVDSSTAFFDERWSNATGEAINAMKFDANTGRWIFETEDSLYTMDQGGANVQSQLSLAAGEKIVDIQSGEGHIVYVVRKADYSFELFVCDSSWANIKDSASMQPILASHEAIDVNYDADSDLWTASSASGVVISTDDLSNWLI